MADNTDQKNQPPVEGEVVDKKAKKAASNSGLTDKDKREITRSVYTTETGVMNPVEYEQMRKIANDFWKAGALPKSYDNAEQVFMAMQMGRQMGMSPHESIINGYYVDGKYNVYGKAIPGALRRHGWRWQFTNESQEEVTIELKHADTGEQITDTYSFQDAVDSGFTTSKYGEKFGWKSGSNRRRKLRYAVLSQVVHTYLPEVLGPAAGIAEYSEDYAQAEANAEMGGADTAAELDDKINAAETDEQLQEILSSLAPGAQKAILPKIKERRAQIHGK